MAISLDIISAGSGPSSLCPWLGFLVLDDDIAGCRAYRSLSKVHLRPPGKSCHLLRNEPCRGSSRKLDALLPLANHAVVHLTDKQRRKPQRVINAVLGVLYRGHLHLTLVHGSSLYMETRLTPAAKRALLLVARSAAWAENRLRHRTPRSRFIISAGETAVQRGWPCPVSLDQTARAINRGPVGTTGLPTSRQRAAGLS